MADRKWGKGGCALEYPNRRFDIWLYFHPVADGPVLTQTELYLLEETELHIHPILAQKYDAFQLEFDLQTGINILLLLPVMKRVKMLIVLLVL